MACPVHIWAPLMAAAVPFSRAARDRARMTASRLLRRESASLPAPRELKHWAPIASGAARPAEEQPAPR